MLLISKHDGSSKKGVVAVDTIEVTIYLLFGKQIFICDNILDMLAASDAQERRDRQSQPTRNDGGGSAAEWFADGVRITKETCAGA